MPVINHNKEVTTNMPSAENFEAPADKRPIELKTQSANNGIVIKLFELIKDLKAELARYEPHISDMESYVNALKDDIVTLSLLKSKLKTNY